MREGQFGGARVHFSPLVEGLIEGLIDARVVETVVTVSMSERDEWMLQRAGPTPSDSVRDCFVSSTRKLLRLE